MCNNVCTNQSLVVIERFTQEFLARRLLGRGQITLVHGDLELLQLMTLLLVF